MTRALALLALLATPATAGGIAPAGYDSAIPWPVVDPWPTQYATRLGRECVALLGDDLRGGKYGPMPACDDVRVGPPLPRPAAPWPYGVTVADVLPYAAPVWLRSGSGPGWVTRTPRAARGGHYGGAPILVGGNGGSTVITQAECGKIDCWCEAMPERPDAAPEPEAPPVAPVPVPAGLPMLFGAIMMMVLRRPQ